MRRGNEDQIYDLGKQVQVKRGERMEL